MRSPTSRSRATCSSRRVAGEIEKTQQGEAQGAEYRGYAAGSRYLVGHGGAADMCILGEPTEQKLVLAHFGTLWLRLSTTGPFVHTAFSSGRLEENSIVRMRPVLDAVLAWLPTWEEEMSYGDERGVANVGGDPGRIRLARLAHAASHRSLPGPASPAGRRDGGGAAEGAGVRARRSTGVEAEVYVTAPGAVIDEAHPLVGALEESHAEVFGATPERDVTRWFSDASVLTRYGIATVNYGTSTGLPGPGVRREPRDRRAGEDRGGLRARGEEDLRMKLVTFDDGRVGWVDGDEIAVLDVPTMREWFERGGADETGERVPLAEARLRAPIVPKKFFHTAGNFREHEEESKTVGWSHEIAPWIVFFQNVDAIVGPDEPVVYPEHLTEELDYELELAVVLEEGRQVVPARGGGGLHRRLRDLQRHHGARHPAARDALRRLQLLQGDRHLLPARAVDRDAGRDPRPARPGDGAARERRRAPDVALGPDERDDPGDPQPLLGARLLGRATCSRPGR